MGSGGGGNHQQQQSHHSNHRGHAASGTGGFVSSRQGEGGSLPSNVNTRSAEVRFIAEMEAVPRRRGPKNNSESGRSSDDYEMGVLNGGEAMSKAAARSVAARGTSLGLDTDIPYAQMASPCSENMSVIINMGEYGTEDQDEESLLVITNQAKKVTSHVSMGGRRKVGEGLSFVVVIHLAGDKITLWKGFSCNATVLWFSTNLD